MITLSVKSFLMAISLCVVNTGAWAHLKANTTVINSTNGSAAISVSFPMPVSGDLYIATEINGQLFFFTDGGKKLTPDIVAFTKNSIFAEDRVLLTIFSEGIPANIYSLYQVVTVAGKNPLDSNNWIGGLGGLSELKLSINLPTDIVITTPTPSSASNGKKLFETNCLSCHGSNPKQNVNDILKGKDIRIIRDAINKNKGNMGVLNGISDLNLQAVADYLKTF
jgi:hypothetical protein